MRTVLDNTKYSFCIMIKCTYFECDMFYLLEFDRHGEVICSLNSINEKGIQKGLRETIWPSWNSIQVVPDKTCWGNHHSHLYISSLDIPWTLDKLNERSRPILQLNFKTCSFSENSWQSWSSQYHSTQTNFRRVRVMRPFYTL